MMSTTPQSMIAFFDISIRQITNFGTLVEHIPHGRVTAGILPPLLRLPYEIRLIIYNYCLLVDYEIVPHLSLYCAQLHLSKFSRLGRRFLKDRYSMQPPSSPTLPSLNLLAVNKQLFEETAPILYGKNTWTMPVVTGDNLFRRGDHNVFVRHAKLFRHISVKFDWHEMTDMIFDAYLHRNSLNDSQWYPHHRDRILTLNHWQTRHTCGVLHKLYEEMELVLPHLTSLVIKVDDLYCSLGCCRAQVLGQWLKNGFIASLGKNISTSSLSRIEFTGLKDAEEKEMVYGDWGFEESGVVSKERLSKRWASKKRKKNEPHRSGAHQSDGH